MIILRNMTLSDLPAVDQVQRASFIPELWEDMSLFKGILDGYAHSSFVAQREEEILGYLLTYPTILERDDFDRGWRNLSGDEAYLYIHDLCVHPDARGMGIANLLLEKLEAFARESSFHKFAAIAVQDAGSFWLKQRFSPLKPYPYHGEPGELMIKEGL